ncbi:MAG: hypothetical protein U0869_03925 [Chloroflexota bacterium]
MLSPRGRRLHRPGRACLDFLVRRYPNARGWVVAVAEEGGVEMLALRRAALGRHPQPRSCSNFPLYLTLGQTLDDVDEPLAEEHAPHSRARAGT